MQIVILTALGVGLATVFGSLIGFALKKIPHRFNDIVLGFAAGIMLAAAVLGLVVPAVEKSDGIIGLIIVIAGIMCGALFLSLVDRFVPHMHRITGTDKEKHGGYGPVIITLKNGTIKEINFDEIEGCLQL